MAHQARPTQRGRTGEAQGGQAAGQSRRRGRVLLAVLLAGLLLAGCFGNTPAEPAPALATPVEATASAGSTDAGSPAAAVTGTAATGATTDTARVAATALETPAMPTRAPALALAPPGAVLDSYSMAALYVITSTFADGSQQVDRTAVEGSWQRTDGAQFPFDAQLVVDNLRGDQQQQLALVVLGPDAAIRADGQWTTIARDGNIPYADPDTVLSLPFVTRVNRGETVGREQIAGTDTTHYRIADPAAFAAVMAEGIGADSGQVAAMLLEGWVADAGYVARYALEAQFTGATMLDAQGNRVVADQAISASYALSDIDSAPPITWPEDAQPPGTTDVPGFAPNTFPVPDGAQLLPKLGLLELVSPDDPDTVTAFYRDRLAVLGWAMQGEFGFYTLSKDDKTLTLTVLPDEAATLTIVRVFAP